MTTPQEPPEQPAVGPLLTEARLRRGLSLSDVERQTRIPRRYLQALEADDFNILPAPVYARGFLRNYARFLGLDENEIVRGLSLGNPQPSVLPVVAQPRNPDLWKFGLVAFAIGLLLWAVLGLKVYNLAGDLVDDITGGSDSSGPTPIITTPTPVPSCDELASRAALTPEEQRFFDQACATPTPEPPTAVPDRTDCEEIRGTDYRSEAERQFFLGNCLTPPAGG
jgi:transcriptional regulator with XRE-family HTH domain